MLHQSVSSHPRPLKSHYRSPLWMSVQALLGLESGRSCTMKQSGFGGVDECAFTFSFWQEHRKKA